MMAEVVALRPTLSDSTFKTRPNFRTIMMSDTNAGLDAMEQIEAARRARQMKFPRLHGNKTPNSMQEPISTPSFRKYNDEGDHRPPAPTRFFDNLMDPVSGFLSTGADIARKTGVTKLKNFVHVSDTPQDNAPQLYSSSRIATSAPSELRRKTRFDPPQPSYWNSRKTLDISTRAKLGGWTSEKNPKKEGQISVEKSGVEGSNDTSRDLRDQLALNYMYKSSTQRQYEDVPWDNMLPPKNWAPTTTLEPKPDQVDQRHQLKRYVPEALEYQLVGRSWDWFQTRNGYHKKQQWIDYTSPCPRAQQIPLYGGSIGADNLDEMDNQHEAFTPYTVKRSIVPREAETSHRPNIPNYTGCTLYRSVRQSSPCLHETTTPGPSASAQATTTGTVHRSLQTEGQPIERKRESHMSKMVTTVPPYNPFNKLDSMPQKIQI